jgi:hypothetical protein
MASTLKSLPDERYITMKLLYYDERTPDDYQPAFFKGANGEEMLFENKPVKVRP